MSNDTFSQAFPARPIPVLRPVQLGEPHSTNSTATLPDSTDAQDYCAANGLHLNGTFSDAAGQISTPQAERPSGRELHRRLNASDAGHVPERQSQDSTNSTATQPDSADAARPERIAVYGYAQTFHPFLQMRCEADQHNLIRDYCRKTQLCLAEIFTESGDDWEMPVMERPAGKKLFTLLRPGDAIVIADFATLVCSRVDHVRTLRHCRDNRITLHLLIDKRWMAWGSALQEWSANLLEWDTAQKRKLRSERAKRAIQTLREQGRRHTRHPGYGFKWEGRKGRKKRVPDQAERRVMSQIHDLRTKNVSWDAIHVRLLKNRVRTRDGREWSRSRIIRADAAEQKLRMHEAKLAEEEQQ